MQSFRISDAPPIGVAEFLTRIEAFGTPAFDPEYVARCAELLACLGAEKNLIADYVTSGGLQGWLSHFSAPQSFTLGRSENFALRANIWLPIKESSFASHERELYAYHGLAHSHNFRFLTIGYFGPGYSSEVCEIDPQEIEGLPGEQVTLHNRRIEHLDPGRIMYFEADRDIHVQREPEALSVSVNLLFRSDSRPKDQLFFDLDRSCVVEAPLDTLGGRRAGAMRMAALIGDPAALDLLQRLAAEHERPLVREDALRALGEVRRIEGAVCG